MAANFTLILMGFILICKSTNMFFLLKSGVLKHTCILV